MGSFEEFKNDMLKLDKEEIIDFFIEQRERGYENKEKKYNKLKDKHKKYREEIEEFYKNKYKKYLEEIEELKKKITDKHNIIVKYKKYLEELEKYYYE